MKGIIILILILAALGIWWAKRTPESIGGLSPETVNGAANVLDGANDGTDTENGNTEDGAEFEDKG